MTPPDQQHTNLESQLEKKLSSLEYEKIEEDIKKNAVALKLPYVNLTSYPVDMSALLLVDEADARTGRLAIITKSGQKLTIAVRDPKNAQTIYVVDTLKNRGFEVVFVLVSDASLEVAWQKYSLKQRAPQEQQGIVSIKTEKFQDIEQKIHSLEQLKEHLAQLPVTDVLDSMLTGALHIKASDIHIEPEEKQIRLRYRLDGILQDVINFDKSSFPNILSRIKILSGLKLNIHETPQDGRFTIRKEAKDIEIRVSVLPGAYGENIVMRILDPESINLNLTDLGMRASLLDKVKKLLQKTTGVILNTGPTGSGKTTTLYAFIKAANTPGDKIITIEDPIEYHIQGISQTQIDEQAGYTFVNGLRSIMRQDPDIILIGEIRDSETAEIAMQAALTGHLVFSTLHTNDAAGAIPRLIDLGVRPATIAPAIKASMAQRLARRLCLECRKKDTITKEDHDLLTKYIPTITAEAQDTAKSIPRELYYPVGCAQCNQSGYKGRIGIYELFEIDADIERLILTSPAISQIQDMAIQKGMLTLLQDGLLRVMEGITTTYEIIRIIGE